MHDQCSRGVQGQDILAEEIVSSKKSELERLDFVLKRYFYTFSHLRKFLMKFDNFNDREKGLKEHISRERAKRGMILEAREIMTDCYALQYLYENHR